jgi:hypothetical protein
VGLAAAVGRRVDGVGDVGALGPAGLATRPGLRPAG